ncbi:MULTISPECIES: carbon starvation protein A [Peptoniphilus]|jgi:carbon starvation protein A|uniref:carbon starvation CstA family protein n=1 Tax=Peptoniphilus TaxID=162289 RepID=UPI000289B625|nr:MULTISPECIES: carbon starvation CstA family protein [Peptoniphilus]MBS6610438.1 carbon starvation protein A [Peptoniphilus harei]MDU1043086.1 carbon starvation CstA family protein [Peptoniphilus rhinitidis]MDU1955105.1 carbon starvation CstA family protein [Peptoniphilus lacydonensis]MDU2109511.1 carbon starvation CstA family protein [Peptoniphilus lacydonensis]MDU3750832.1 carbon starvation CstA family protein [Peptoniphilus rhinitidis]
MLLFIIGLIILFAGGFFYSKYVESQLQPDDRETPAVKKADGVDYVVMSEKKNWLINLLNIAGTGPILGPIQGILFGPIAFLAIPIGCVFAGAVHDYMTGFISMRNGGSQVPKLVGKYVGDGVRKFYNVVIAILLLLTGVVFVYTPGDLIANDILKVGADSNAIWIIYAVIFIYYILSTILPIDKLIGRIYPIFGAFLIISALGVFIGIFAKGNNQLAFANAGLLAEHPLGQKFIPSFFITVACGILSGFHGSQVTLVSRTIKSESEAKRTFYSTMIAEGFIAMVWAAGAIVIFSSGMAPLDTAGTLMVGKISKYFMGNIGGFLAILGVIALPITSGDTAFRSLRLIVSEELNIDQKSPTKRAGLAAVLFIPAIAILYFAKSNPNGFNMLWRYFGFTNQFVATFALAVASIYLMNNNKNYFITLIPGAFYTFIVFSFILNVKGLGFGLPFAIAYPLAGIIAFLYVLFIIKTGKKNHNRIESMILD